MITSARSRLFLVALITGIVVACNKGDDAPVADSAAAEPSVPAAIDTTVPTILGIAANRTPGAAGWCMLSAHRDVWVGRPVKVVWTTYRKILNTKVGDTIPGCPGPDPTPGAKAYELTFETEPPLESFPAVVLRNDVWGNVRRDLTAEFHLDGDQVWDTITVCTTGSAARFHMAYGGEIPRRPWKHEFPYESTDEPRCADAPVVAADPNAPVMHMTFEILPATYEPPYGVMWMALRTSDAGSTLVKTPVLPMVAERGCRNGQSNGKRLLAAAAPEGYTAMFLNLPGLTEGTVERAQITDFGGSMMADSVYLALKGDRVYIRREPIGTTGFRVTAQVGASMYTLFETPTSELGRSNVRWAGDLDRDGAIDFILLAHQRNWQSGSQLHLSSQRTALAWPAAATFLHRPC